MAVLRKLWNLLNTYSDTDSGKVGRDVGAGLITHLRVLIQRMRWCDGSKLSHQWALLGNKFQFWMGRTDWPLCAMGFKHTFYIVLFVRMMKYRCFAETTHKIAVP